MVLTSFPHKFLSQLCYCIIDLKSVRRDILDLLFLRRESRGLSLHVLTISTSELVDIC